MKKRTKKFISVLLSVIVISNFAIPVFASNKTYAVDDNIKKVRTILADVNEEFGTDIEIPDQTMTRSSSKLNDAPDGVISEETISQVELTTEILAQFESEIVEYAEFMNKENSKAENAWKTAIKDNTVDDSIAVRITRAASPSRLPKSGYKSFTGARSVFFEGWANYYSGYWKWEYLNKTTVTRDVGSNTYQFALNPSPKDYKASIIENGRMYAVYYYGTMYKKTVLGWVPSSSTQYLSWSASM